LESYKCKNCGIQLRISDEYIKQFNEYFDSETSPVFRAIERCPRCHYKQGFGVHEFTDEELFQIKGLHTTKLFTFDVVESDANLPVFDSIIENNTGETTVTFSIKDIVESFKKF